MTGAETDRFRELVERHYEEIWRFASFCAFGSAEVEDVVQEAFLAAFERLRKGRAFEGDPGDWLRAVVRNLVRQQWRKGRKFLLGAPGALEALAQETDRPLDTLVRDEAHGLLAGCLDRLPEAERGLLDRRYNADETPETMASAEGMNTKTLRVRLHRIRQRLKQCLESKLPEWCDL